MEIIGTIVTVVGIIVTIVSIPEEKRHALFSRWRIFLSRPRPSKETKVDILTKETGIFTPPNITKIPVPEPPTDPSPSLSYDPTHFATPPVFRGRVRELEQLARHLENGESVLIEGDFRIGKTSLLKTWEERAIENGREARFLDGQKGEASGPAAFARAITGQPAPDDPDEAAETIKEWAAARTLPPLVLLDEVPAFARGLPLRLFERLRGMLDELRMVVASPRDLDSLYQEQNRTSPFANRLRLLRLGLLEADAARQIAAWSGQPNLLLHWAGRHPFYLQLLGSHLASAHSPDEALAGFRDEGCQQLRKVWRELSPREQDNLLALRTGKPVSLESLRRRGLLTEDGEFFGEILRVFLEDAPKT
uniref:AAA ATPase domain-containing protein n=1 Tax=Candidatus Kentrum sp. LPFa TaxID=2126335 RepID=A0A450XSQ9_9GAMM|nr:MAG: AAA ATPase domain-containing protein [Candidatus Kentron sp. LPFa]VFK32313.1 MAG: AAA ATPase domain-containing protein [Candidatus Kentron sp. LPFa]